MRLQLNGVGLSPLDLVSTAAFSREGLSEELSGAPDSLVDYAQVGGALAQQRAAEESAQRLSLRGSGDRSERIRTYNAPHDRVADRVEINR